MHRDLPIVTAADVRLAEAVLQIQPGYLPMKPNGDPMFRGSQFNSRINGGQARATENVFDGAAFGYAVGHQASHERAAGGSVAGSEGHHHDLLRAVRPHQRRVHRVHLEVGHQHAARQPLRIFRARRAERKGFFALGKTPLRNDNFSVTLGGRCSFRGRPTAATTFFFTNIDWTRFRSGVLPGFGSTTPIDAFKSGDFSALPGSIRLASTRLAGRFCQGQIFNPATTRLVNGIPVRDPYPGNVIPAGDPLRSQSGRAHHRS